MEVIFEKFIKCVLLTIKYRGGNIFLNLNNLFPS